MQPPQNRSRIPISRLRFLTRTYNPTVKSCAGRLLSRFTSFTVALNRAIKMGLLEAFRVEPRRTDYWQASLVFSPVSTLAFQMAGGEEIEPTTAGLEGLTGSISLTYLVLPSIPFALSHLNRFSAEAAGSWRGQAAFGRVRSAQRSPSVVSSFGIRVWTINRLRVAGADLRTCDVQRGKLRTSYHCSR